MHKNIQKLASKTKTQFDDILIRKTRLPTLLWCFWLGIYVGFTASAAPDSWSQITDKIIPVLFVTLGIYTLVMILMATLKWFKVEVCTSTSSSLDDIIVGILMFGTPVVGAALGSVLILNMLGVNMVTVNSWLGDHGIKLAVLTVVIVTLLLLTTLVIPKVIVQAVRNSRSEQTEEEMKKRSDTLVSVIITTIQIILIFMFIMMALTELGINVTAALAGAGVIGLAIGFGAQSLVKDILAGLFIIMENQYRKGDIVTIAGQSGVVEEINLRRTTLRDVEGTYHVVPNGLIGISSNQTKQLSRINLAVNVSYSTDLDKAMAVINRVGKEMSMDPPWSSFILSPPKALRVDRLGDSGIEIRVRGETKPSRQWEVAGELRLRLKKAFDKEGIEIPFPHSKIFFGNQPPEFDKNTEPEELPK